MRPTPGAVIFDLDGTLIDSGRDITTAVNAMRADLDLPPLSVEQVAGIVGEGARMLVRRALPADSPSEAVNAALASYRAHYGRVLLDTTRPYPGVMGMLAGLAVSMPLAALSNKSEANSRQILERLGLNRYLREVVGGDTLPTRKPNPGGVYLLADRLHVPVERLVLVGDSRIDAATAAAAGCGFALAAWGGAAALVPAASGSAGRTPATAEPAEAVEPAPDWCFATPGELASTFGGDPLPADEPEVQPAR